MPFTSNDNRPTYYRHRHTPDARAGVVFLHGHGEHSGFYHRFAAHLNSMGIEMWASDALGHGHTGGPLNSANDIPALADAAAEVIELVAAANPDLPLSLIGHSMGGITAAYLLSTTAIRPASIVLSGTPFEEVDTSVWTQYDGGEPTMSLDESYLDALAVDPLISKDEVDRDEQNAGGAVARAAVEAAVAEWDVPVLVLSGDKDVIAPPVLGARWAAKMKNAEFVSIPGHHDVMNDLAHAEVAKAMGQFVLRTTVPV